MSRFPQDWECLSRRIICRNVLAILSIFDLAASSTCTEDLCEIFLEYSVLYRKFYDHNNYFTELRNVKH